MNIPRIALCGLGYVGSFYAKFAMIKDWEIVAAYNRAGEKVGKDVGEVCGLDKNIGVVVEDAHIRPISSALLNSCNHLWLNTDNRFTR